MSRKIKNFQHSFLTMTKSHNENGIDDKTLEIEAGEAKAQELALCLEELNKTKSKENNQKSGEQSREVEDCKSYYCSCIEMQPITGHLLAHP